MNVMEREYVCNEHSTVFEVVKSTLATGFGASVFMRVTGVALITAAARFIDLTDAELRDMHRQSITPQVIHGDGHDHHHREPIRYLCGMCIRRPA
jgi:hypothetical protein